MYSVAGSDKCVVAGGEQTASVEVEDSHFSAGFCSLDAHFIVGDINLWCNGVVNYRFNARMGILNKYHSEGLAFGECGYGISSIFAK